MRIAIAPGSSRTAVATIRSLLNRPSNEDLEVYAIYRDLNKVPTKFSSHSNFCAVHGDVSDETSLDFAGCDAVLVITPPAYDGRDLVEHAKKVSKNVKNAIERAGSVNTLVLLSSEGAQFSQGVGEIKTNNKAEEVFSTTKVNNIIYVRCVYFMENWTTNLDTLKAPTPFFFSTITPADYQIPMVAVSDIGSVLATELIKNHTLPTKPHIINLRGPRDYSPLDVQAAFSEAFGRDVDLRLVEKGDLRDFYAQVFPPQILDYWVEMAESILPGGLLARDETIKSDVPTVYGKTELGTAIKEAVGHLSMPEGNK